MKQDHRPTYSRLRRVFRTGMLGMAMLIGIGLMVSPLVNLQSLQDYEAGRGTWASEKLVLHHAKSAMYHIATETVGGFRKTFMGSTSRMVSSTVVRAALRPASCITLSAAVSNSAGNLQQAAGIPQLSSHTNISWQAPCSRIATNIPATIARLTTVNVPSEPDAVTPDSGPRSQQASNSAAVTLQATDGTTTGAASQIAVPKLQSLRDRADCSEGVLLNVVAHQDDDLLFMNPDLMAAVMAGQCVRTVYLTAGDSGQQSDYWLGREAGAKNAYAHMFSLPNVWQDSRQTLDGQSVEVSYLRGAPNVGLVFLRLPDGNLHGEGFAATQFESLSSLFNGSLLNLRSVDADTVFTKDQLVAALQAIMTTDHPDAVHTLGLSATADGDHSDHQAAAEFTMAAARQYGAVASITRYGGYPETLLLPNIPADAVAAKQDIFFAYAVFDDAVCQDVAACAETDTYSNYLTREYKEDVPVSPVTPTPTP